MSDYIARVSLFGTAHDEESFAWSVNGYGRLRFRTDDFRVEHVSPTSGCKDQD